MWADMCTANHEDHSLLRRYGQPVKLHPRLTMKTTRIYQTRAYFAYVPYWITAERELHMCTTVVLQLTIINHVVCLKWLGKWTS